jgi:hypothetical protein
MNNNDHKNNNNNTRIMTKIMKVNVCIEKRMKINNINNEQN